MKNPLVIVTRDEIVDLRPLMDLMHETMEVQSMRSLEIILLEIIVHLKEQIARDFFVGEEHVEMCEALRATLKRCRTRLT